MGSEDSMAYLGLCTRRHAFGPQTQICWGNPKPLKVLGMVLTSAVRVERRCLLACFYTYNNNIAIFPQSDEHTA